MYFSEFPYTYYTLDDRGTVQVVTNITSRVKLSDEVKSNLSLYDEYDIRDGDTPEIVADRFYNNSQLHWLILHTNDILDPRFQWPLSTSNLAKHVTDKYNNINAPHHYIDEDDNYTNATVILNLDNTSNLFPVGSVLTNNTNIGTAYVTTQTSNSNVTISVTTGGFIAGDSLHLSSNTQATANVSSTVLLSGVPVTNYDFEDAENETKRRIKILKSQYVDSIISEFKRKLGEA